MMQPGEIEETLERHSTLFDMVEQVTEKHTDLLLQMTKAYFELLEGTAYQKKVMQAQGNLINGCMERIMQLEGRSVLGNFNQRLEQLESWLYTHDYLYYQEQERENATIEKYQQGIADNAQLDGYGTHAPNCCCLWCEPPEGVILSRRSDI